MKESVYRKTDNIPSNVQPFRTDGLFSRDKIVNTLSRCKKLHEDINSLWLTSDIELDSELYMYLDDLMRRSRRLLDKLQKTLDCPF